MPAASSGFEASYPYMTMLDTVCDTWEKKKKLKEKNLRSISRYNTTGISVLTNSLIFSPRGIESLILEKQPAK